MGRDARAEAVKDPKTYIENVVLIDFGRPLDELIALVILACGLPPPPKPYTAVGEWKGRAIALLSDSVPASQRTQVTGYVHKVVLIALHVARKQFLSGDQVKSYADQIKVVRRPRE